MEGPARTGQAQPALDVPAQFSGLGDLRTEGQGRGGKLRLWSLFQPLLLDHELHKDREGLFCSRLWPRSSLAYCKWLINTSYMNE